MQYKDLKEMTFKDWDGKPILCYVNNALTNEITPNSVKVTKVVSFNGEAQHPWGDTCEQVYHSVYPVHLNEALIATALRNPRMTNRQLAMWLAKGNGQIMYLSHTDLSVDKTACVQTSHSYSLRNEFFECNDRIRVRRWDSEEWVEPTVDLLEDC